MRRRSLLFLVLGMLVGPGCQPVPPTSLPSPPAVVPSVSLGSITQSGPVSNRDDAVYRINDLPGYPSELATGLGRELVSTHCSVCHSTTYITMQPPLPAAAWDKVMHKMTEVYGATIPDEDAQAILTYLKEHYTPEKRRPDAAATLVPEAGQALYMQHCAVCHQPDGKGVRGAFPPLNGRVPELSKSYLIRTVLYGRDSEEVKGAMPEWGSRLSDTELAALLTYVTQTWSNARLPAITPTEVHDERSSKP